MFILCFIHIFTILTRISIISYRWFQLFSGDPCETPEGVAGECKFPTDCPSSLGAIKRRDELKICGYVGQRATICCEHSKSTTTTTTTTTTTLTTTTSTDIPKTTTEKERKYPVGAILSESKKNSCNLYSCNTSIYVSRMNMK